MSYNINPCKACWQKYKNGDCNINELNDCVVDTATAFSTFPSNESLRGTPVGQNWQDCMSQKMAELPYQAGEPRTFCNFQLNVAPRWLEVPHYFPQLLEDTKDPKKALSLCHQKCQSHRLPNTCSTVCQTDHNAVEMISPKKKAAPSAPPCLLREAYDKSVSEDTKDKKKGKKKKKKDKGPTFQDEANKNPAAFWIVFSIVAVLLAIILVFFFVALFSRRIGN